MHPLLTVQEGDQTLECLRQVDVLKDERLTSSNEIRRAHLRVRRKRVEEERWFLKDGEEERGEDERRVGEKMDATRPSLPRLQLSVPVKMGKVGLRFFFGLWVKHLLLTGEKHLDASLRVTKLRDVFTFCLGGACFLLLSEPLISSSEVKVNNGGGEPHRHVHVRMCFVCVFLYLRTCARVFCRVCFGAG